MTSQARDLVVGGAAVVFGGAVAVAAGTIPNTTGTAVGPGAFPLVVGVAVALAGLAVAVPALRRGGRPARGAPGAGVPDPASGSDPAPGSGSEPGPGPAPGSDPEPGPGPALGDDAGDRDGAGSGDGGGNGAAGDGGGGEGGESVPRRGAPRLARLALPAGIAAFCAVALTVSLTVASGAAFLLCCRYMAGYRWPRSALIGLAGAAAVHLVFRSLLDVPLPGDMVL